MVRRTLAVLFTSLLLSAPLSAQVRQGGAVKADGSESGSGSGTVTTTGTLASGQVALGSGATSVTSNDGLTHQGSGTTFKLGLGTRVFLSSPSAGTLLVEDGSGAARDVQARTVFAPTLDAGGGSAYLTFTDYHAGAARTAYFDAGHFYPALNNLQDVGVEAAMWRTGYFGTSLYSPLFSGGPAATGTNVAGGNLTIRPGAGTGSATGSSLVFQTPTAGASGTTAQTQTTRLTVNETDGVVLPNTTFYRGFRVDGTTSIKIAGMNSSNKISIDPDEQGSVFGGTVRLKGYTVATLPAGTVGDTAYCTDLTAPTFMAVAVGGGAVVGKVFYDGTNWITD